MGSALLALAPAAISWRTMSARPVAAATCRAAGAGGGRGRRSQQEGRSGRCLAALNLSAHRDRQSSLVSSAGASDGGQRCTHLSCPEGPFYPPSSLPAARSAAGQCRRQHCFHCLRCCCCCRHRRCRLRLPLAAKETGPAPAPPPAGQSQSAAGKAGRAGKGANPSGMGQSGGWALLHGRIAACHGPHNRLAAAQSSPERGHGLS